MSSAPQDDCSPDTPDWDSESEPLLQEAFKAVMEPELHGATWESQIIMQHLLPHDSKLVAEVCEYLQVVLGETVKLGQNGRISDGDIQVGEKKHYSSFAKLLNYTFRTAQDALGSNAGPYYSSLRFSTYDRPIGDSVDTGHELKPGLVGCDEDVQADRTVFWHEICIPVEVNEYWSDIVVRAAAYARCMFSASSGRQSVLVIALQHLSNEVRFLFFHRGGLTSSPPFDLKIKDGFALFVSAMVGLASVKDRVSAGMDDSLNNSQICLPLGGVWKVEDWLYTGHCVRGRATQVVRVSGQTAAASGSKKNCATGENAGSDASGARMGTPTSKETIEKVQRQPEFDTLNCHDESVTPLDDSLADLVIKDSWPLIERNNEKRMYEATQGLFGVPEVLASYEVRGPDSTWNTTYRFLPANSTPWIVWEHQPDDAKPEMRVHTRHLYKTIGRDLFSASSPRELLEGILHAMIGYLNYYEKGYMHHDISIGNVMLLEKKLTCLAFQHIPILADKTDCIGMLIDGDHAVEWRDIGRTKAAPRSGTLPFMSMRLITAWHFGDPYEHSSIDDLESFMWLLIWCIYSIMEVKVKDGREVAWLKTLRSPIVETHFVTRGGILMHLSKSDEIYGVLSPLEALFQPLLLDWQNLLVPALKEMMPLLKSSLRSNEALLTTTRRHFEQFFTAGFRHLATLPENWDSITAKK